MAVTHFKSVFEGSSSALCLNIQLRASLSLTVVKAWQLQHSRENL